MSERSDRTGLLPNTGPCPYCGEIHPYVTTIFETRDGEILCGIPILWTDMQPAPISASFPGPCVDPPHGMLVALATRLCFRQAITWRADERGERRPDLTLDEAAAIWEGRR